MQKKAKKTQKRIFATSLNVGLQLLLELRVAAKVLLLFFFLISL